MLIRLNNWFDSRLYRVNGVLTVCSLCGVVADELSHSRCGSEARLRRQKSRRTNENARTCQASRTLATFRVSRRRREMYCGHARLRACVCLSVRGRMPTLLHGPGRNLGEC